MTLEEFIAEEKDRLFQFEQHWKLRSFANPEQYPMAMYPGDWDEQYQMFIASDKGSC